MQPSSALSNAAEWTSTGKVVNTLKIQMTPIDLGLVTATMRLSGDALNVDLKVETGAAYRQLKEDARQDHRACFAARVIAIDNVTISMAPAAKESRRGEPGRMRKSSLPSSNRLQQAAGRLKRASATPRQHSGAIGGLNGAGETSVEDCSLLAASGGGASGSVYL